MGLSKSWRHVWSALLLRHTMATPLYFAYICLSAIDLSLLLCVERHFTASHNDAIYLNVDVVDTAADSDNNPQLFELLQVLLSEADRVPHQSSHGFV